MQKLFKPKRQQNLRQKIGKTEYDVENKKSYIKNRISYN